MKTLHIKFDKETDKPLSFAYSAAFSQQFNLSGKSAFLSRKGESGGVGFWRISCGKFL